LRVNFICSGNTTKWFVKCWFKQLDVKVLYVVRLLFLLTKFSKYIDGKTS